MELAAGRGAHPIGRYEVVWTGIVPDEQAQIEAALRQMADDGDIQLLVTTGGTGFAPRDVTPEATLAVCDRLTPGIPEAMRSASMQVTARAIQPRTGGAFPRPAPDVIGAGFAEALNISDRVDPLAVRAR